MKKINFYGRLFFLLVFIALSLFSCPPPGNYGGDSDIDSDGGEASWQVVGPELFSPNQAYYTSLAISADGTPYVAFQDWSSSSGILGLKVMKYDGSSWVDVSGVYVLEGAVDYISLQLSHNGSPYVAFRQGYGKGYLYYLSDTNWVALGSYFSEGEVNYISFAMYNDIPYLLYRETRDLSVRKWNGSSWEYLGTRGFAEASPGTPICLALDSSGTPYVAFSDYQNTDKLKVMKYNGSSWETVGSAGFSEYEISSMALGIDSDIPYVVYQNYDESGGNYSHFVKKYDAGWVQVGNANLSTGLLSFLNIAFYNHTPYLAFTDGGSLIRATVLKLEGASWVAVGQRGFSKAAATYLSLAFTASGRPYVAFSDGRGSKATVMKYVE